MPLLLWEQSERWLVALRRELRGDPAHDYVRSIASAEEARTQLLLTPAALLIIELRPEWWPDQSALLSELPAIWPSARAVACAAYSLPVDVRQWLDELGVLALFTSRLQIRHLAALARRWRVATAETPAESVGFPLLPQFDLPLPPLPNAGQ